ncbi:MAG: fimbrillin family protein [Parabacteroides sp.]|nr:fimbrillin family protein [Parabacteroides sp.]
MKRKIMNLLLPLVPLLVAGCSDAVLPADNGADVIRLYTSGSGLPAATKGETETAVEITPFETTVFASLQSATYATSATGSWTHDADVDEKGAVSFTADFKPTYPDTGGNIYLVAVSPVVAAGTNDAAVGSITSDGTVTYTLDGTQDLLYAKEISGNRTDGYRFSGNTTAANKPLAYEHLLTQLQFKAKMSSGIASGTTATVKKITVNNVKTAATVKLANGTTTFADSPTASLELIPNTENGSGGVTVSGTTPVAVGNLLLPPLASGTYTITVEATVGSENKTYSDVSITGENLFQAGHSHVITLTIGSPGEPTSLEITSVKVDAWTTVDKGELSTK